VPADNTPTTSTGRCRGVNPEPRRAAAGRDAGSISVLVAVLGFALLLMLGLVVDGGRQLIAYRRAANDAEQAARAGAGALNPAGLRTGTYILSPAAAAAAARRYLSASQPDGRITASSITVTGNTVAVAVTIRRTTTFLAGVGITGVSATGRGRAQLVHGVAVEDP